MRLLASIIVDAFSSIFFFFCFLGFCLLSCDVKVLIRNGNENRNDERMGRLVGLVGLNWIFGTN